MDEKLVFVADCLRVSCRQRFARTTASARRATNGSVDREQGPEGLVERLVRRTVTVGRCAGAGRGDCRSASGGPRKLRAVLMGRPEAVEHGASAACGRACELAPPAPSSCCRARAALPCRHRVWCIDFKGWFRTRDGERCDPLTVSDAYSRFLLACVIVPPRTDTVRALFTYGVPLAIRQRGDVSRRSAGSRPASRWSAAAAQQNGRHERMHH